MTGNFTPGPWFVDDELGTVESRLGTIPFYSGFVEGAYSLIQGDATEESIANARLIAASPCLLEACIALQAEARARGCGLKIADDAIASALGQGEGQ